MWQLNRLLMLFLLLHSGCSANLDSEATRLWEYPTNIPAFIARITQQLERDNSYCYVIAVLDGYVIWENRNTAQELLDSIDETLILHIDNSLVQDTQIFLYEEVAAYRLGEVGTYIPEIPLCIDIDGFTTGLHIANLQLKSVSGFEYQHRWAFNLIDQ